MAGYSGTPLIKKLGIKEDSRMLIVNPPSNSRQLFTGLPPGVKQVSGNSKDIDFIHFFTLTRKDLEKRLPALMKQVKQDGTVWISWYKKSAGIPTDITEDVIRAVALPMGLVDVKVCAVDDQWSGLKLVIRKENRKK